MNVNENHADGPPVLWNSLRERLSVVPKAFSLWIFALTRRVHAR